MEWTNQYDPHSQLSPDFSPNVHIIQQPAPQPTTVFQQLPSGMTSPSMRPGHVREDLVEMMMLQNAQMHQVIMSNMTMSALSSFGYTQTQESDRSHVVADVDPEVYYHHYPPAPCLSCPAWVPLPMPQLQLLPPFFHNSLQPELQQAAQPVPTQHRRAVPPPPPPSATQTVGADVPPAAEYYDATERRHRGLGRGGGASA